MNIQESILASFSAQAANLPLPSSAEEIQSFEFTFALEGAAKDYRKSIQASIRKLEERAANPAAYDSSSEDAYAWQNAADSLQNLLASIW